MLRGISFRKCTLIGLDFSDADLVEADFRDAVLTECSLRGASLQTALFRNTDLRGCDLGSLNFSDAGALHGAIISSAQATELLGGFGLTVL